MKILLVGAEICPPWTEGRKRFVNDLGKALSKRHDVHLLTTAADPSALDIVVPNTAAPARTRLQHLTALNDPLRELMRSFRPDLVCHFPYGTFRHLYALVNIWHMRFVDRICAAASIPCLTMLYSITGEMPARRLQRWVRCLVLNDFTAAPGGHVVRLGVDFAAWPTPVDSRSMPNAPRLLFMAGMWQKSRTRLEHVLEVRGLKILLQCGAKLAARNMRLTVTSPLLANPALQEHLRGLEVNTWPPDRLELRGESHVPSVYLEHDLFIFPYMREETQFIPTSVVEAMRTGTPVVLPDLKFLQPLAKGDCAFVFRAGDADALEATVTTALADAARYRRVRQQAFAYVSSEMSIERSCNDIETLYADLSGT